MPLTLSPQTKAAVRAFRRLWKPIQAAQSYGRELDAGFDGGEWSGPAHDEIEERLRTELIDRVAKDFRTDPERLDSAIYFTEQDQWYRETTAQQQ